jgi:hypothetical protein
MTTSPLESSDTRAIDAAIMRLIAESRAIDPRAALEGIRARRLPPRSRRHSVAHRAYR